MDLNSVLIFCAGIVVMTLAIKMMSESFQYIVRPVIQKSVGQIKLNMVFNFFWGAVISSSIQSGFSTTVMFVSYLNSGLISLRQLLYVSLGAELGILWVFLLLGFVNFGSLDYYLMLLGFVPMAYGRHRVVEAAGRLCFASGFLLLGYRFSLHLENVALQLHMFKPYFSMSISMGIAYLLFFLIRSEFTLLVINLVAFKVGLFDIEQMVMFSFGVFIAEKMILFKISLSSNTFAKRLSVFFIFINILVLGIYLLFYQWINLQLFTFFKLSNVYTTELFSIISLITLVYVSIILVKSILTVILEKPIFYVIETFLFKSTVKEPQCLKFIGSAYQLSPVLAIEHVLKETVKMAATLQILLSITRSYIEEEEDGVIQKIKKYERILDNVQIEVFDYLSQVMVGHLNLDQGKQVRALTRIADELESGSDCCKAIGLSMNEIRKMGVQLDGGIKGQLLKLFDQFSIYYESFFDLFTEVGGDIKDLRKFSEEFDENLVHLKKDYLAWLKLESGSDYNLEASVKVEDIIRALKQLKGHCQNILEAYRNSF
jgi:phosphate:Na+ symporter